MEIPKATPACSHFRKHGHDFIKRAKVILEQVIDTLNRNKDMENLRLTLREDFWIVNPDSIALKGLNQE